MSFWVIMFAGGVMLAHNTAERSWPHQNDGWRPFVWTQDERFAKRFGSDAEAQLFAITRLGHDQWSVRELFPDQHDEGLSA